EIVTAQVGNALVNRGGTTFAFRLAEETGAGAADIARAFAVAREVFDLPALWSAIEALDGQVPAQRQVSMLLDSRRLLERSTRWLLRNERRPLNVGAAIEHYRPSAALLAEALPRLLGPAPSDAAHDRAADLAAAGVP